MNDPVATFCTLVRARSNENRLAMTALHATGDVISPQFSILRQELDSMVRVIHLLTISEIAHRHRLISSTLAGERWMTTTARGKSRQLTDSEMVEVAQELHGWAQSVYSFGCAFIHLSDYHNHLIESPFEKLRDDEKEAILRHMRSYHGGPASNAPTISQLAIYLPRVFDKIAGNLETYLLSLERGAGIDG